MSKSILGEDGRLDETWEGSVSHGTMREEDLIPAFEGLLKSAGKTLPGRPIEVANLLAGRSVSLEGWERIGFYLNEELFDALNEIAPEGCYFGAHPGDGSDYGFWRDEDEDESEEA